MTDLSHDPQANAILGQFRSARLAADLERLWGRLTGRSADLLPFDEVRAYVKANTPPPTGTPHHSPGIHCGQRGPLPGLYPQLSPQTGQ